jgi:hypothetical protein
LGNGSVWPALALQTDPLPKSGLVCCRNSAAVLCEVIPFKFLPWFISPRGAFAEVTIANRKNPAAGHDDPEAHRAAVPVDGEKETGHQAGQGANRGRTIHPNKEFQDWFKKTFALTIPKTASAIVKHPAYMGDASSKDPFSEWVERVSEGDDEDEDEDDEDEE